MQNSSLQPLRLGSPAGGKGGPSHVSSGLVGTPLSLMYASGRPLHTAQLVWAPAQHTAHAAWLVKSEYTCAHTPACCLRSPVPNRPYPSSRQRPRVGDLCYIFSGSKITSASSFKILECKTIKFRIASYQPTVEIRPDIQSQKSTIIYANVYSRQRIQYLNNC